MQSSVKILIGTYPLKHSRSANRYDFNSKFNDHVKTL